MSLAIAESACRVCLREQEIMISLFDIVEDFQKQRLSDLLEQCTSLKVDRTDNQPKLICDECTGELLVVAKFHKKCLRTLEILSQVETNVVDEEESKHVQIKPERIQIDEADDTINEEDDTGEILTPDYDVDGFIVEKEMTGDEDAEAESSPTQMKEEILYEGVSYVDEEQIILFEPDDTEEEMQANNECKDEQIGEEHIECTQPHKQLRPFSELKDTSAGIIKLRPLVINCKCDVCGAGFTHVNNLSRHIQTHNPIEIYTCGICQCPFTTFEALQRHSQEHQKDVESLEKDLIEEDSESRDCVGALVDSVVTIAANEENRKLKYCDICNKPFISKSALEAHIRTHTGDRPFQCELCPKAFKTQGGLALHLRRHSGVRPYTCNVCNKGFGESSNLRVHMRTHTGEKPHKCTICNRSFTRVFLLQIHLRTHTGERPYQCPYCDKAFAQGGDLASHKRTHTGERPHVCSICKKGFIKSSGLTQHMRKHANHESQKLLDVTDTNDENYSWVIVDGDENATEMSEDETHENLIKRAKTEDDYVIEFPPDIET